MRRGPFFCFRRPALIVFVGALVWVSAVCGGGGDDEGDRDYRQDMRNFVQALSAYARGIDPGFIIIPQNGHQLLSRSEEILAPAEDYLAAIDGAGREDLFYGYEEDDEPTPAAESEDMIRCLDLAEANGVQVLVTDYCWTRSRVDDSYARSAARGYISFAADRRDLDDIPSYPLVPYNVHASDILSLAEARNFLYLLDPHSFGARSSYLDALAGTDYDLLIIDLFYEDATPLDFNEVQGLKRKANGGARPLVAYLCIGEAEDYRYYWDPAWKKNPPSWLLGENSDWPGNYKVRYWDTEWQKIIFGNDASYLKRIIDAGFDGAYLDLVDAFEYFEDQGVFSRAVASQAGKPSPRSLPDLSAPARRELRVDVPLEMASYYRLHLSDFLGSATSAPVYASDAAGAPVIGYRINRILRGSIIDRLGLKNGDVITAVDGVHLDGLRSVLAVFRSAGEDGRVELTVFRDDEKMLIAYRTTSRPRKS